MNTQDVIRIGVIRGGASPEYPFSIESGKTILQALPRDTYRVVDVLITQDGVWHIGGREISPRSLADYIDVAWNTVHGTYGEDGALSHLLDELGIPFVGSDAYVSALTYDKKQTAHQLKRLGFKTPDSYQYDVSRIADVYGHERQSALLELAKTIFATLSGPWVIKPQKGGGSFGVLYVATFAELPDALGSIVDKTDSIIVQPYIRGVEVVAGTAEGVRSHERYSLLPHRVTRAREVFGFFERMEPVQYHPLRETHPQHTPLIQDMATTIVRDFALRGVAVVEFIIDSRGDVWVLEIDTAPHLHPYAYIPQALESAGISISHFCKDVVQKIHTL